MQFLGHVTAFKILKDLKASPVADTSFFCNTWNYPTGGLTLDDINDAVGELRLPLWVFDRERERHTHTL